MSRKFRIFAPMYGFDPDSNLGGEVYDVEILTRLAKRGHIIDAVIRKGQKYPKEKNVNIHYFPFSMGTGIFSVLALPWIFRTGSMRRLVRRADVFRVHSPYFLGLGAALSGSGKPLWFNYHHIENRLQMRFFDRFLPRRAGGITFVSAQTRSDLAVLCDVRDKVTGIAGTAIDTNIFRPVKSGLRKELGLEGKKVVLFVGALIPRKGIDVLIKSWEMLDDVHLVIIGRGPLKSIIPSHERIRHFEFVERERLVEFYGMADVFAFPTRLEGFGMSAGEAMACGTPVVTTNAKGVKDVVDDETGFRVDVDDVDAFTEKIKILLGNEKLRKEMGRNAVKRVRQKFDWERTVDETERFLEELIGDAKG